jgi:multicomponent Na+:H+ antiporter subunit E
LLLNVLLAIAWAALIGDFSPPSLIFGFVLAYAVLWLVTRRQHHGRYFVQISHILEFIVFFAWEVIVANLRMAHTILSPSMNLRPAVVAVPVDLPSEAALILLTNLITLTPGTLSLDISSDHQVLYIHTLFLDNADKFRAEIKQGYERRIREIFKG